MALDKYVRNSIKWCESAIQNHLAARILFTSGDFYVLYPAATLAHHALEMYLKSALIITGETIYNPKGIKDLDASEAITEDQCAWGHKLPRLAQTLAMEQPAFDLKMPLDLTETFIHLSLAVEEAFEHFEPFFSEIRYPKELDNFFGLGTDESIILDALVHALRPFLPDTRRWSILIGE